MFMVFIALILLALSHLSKQNPPLGVTFNFKIISQKHIRLNIGIEILY